MGGGGDYSLEAFYEEASGEKPWVFTFRNGSGEGIQELVLTVVGEEWGDMDLGTSQMRLSLGPLPAGGSLTAWRAGSDFADEVRPWFRFEVRTARGTERVIFEFRRFRARAGARYAATGQREG